MGHTITRAKHFHGDDWRYLYREFHLNIFIHEGCIFYVSNNYSIAYAKEKMRLSKIGFTASTHVETVALLVRKP